MSAKPFPCNQLDQVGVADTAHGTAAFVAHVAEAISALPGFVVRTPTIRLPWLDTPDQEIWAKLECWQHSGSVKIRPAFGAIAALPTSTPVVVATDGNQALAVATAAQQLGHPCTVVVPINASAVRTQRLSDLGAHIEVVGSGANQAIEFAYDLAARNRVPFLGPFADCRAAAFYATCVHEAVADAGPFDNIVVPYGTGTLLAGAGALAASAAHPVDLFATYLAGEPIHSELTPFMGPPGPARRFTSYPFGSTDREENEHPPPVPGDVVYVPVDQTSMAHGTLALLHRQNLLVEGTGAAAVGALLHAQTPVFKGRTLLLLTGSNIGSTELARVLAVDVPQPDVRRRLGLRGRTNALISAAQHIGPPSQRIRSDSPELEDHSNLPSQDQGPFPDLGATAALLAAHRDFAAVARLTLSNPAHEALDEVMAVARSLAARVASNAAPLDEDALRVLLRLDGFLNQALEWASPAQDQSGRINFYNPNSQTPYLPNYARYGDADLRTLELETARTLGFDSNTTELLMTSSGMAAYQLIESYLLRNVLKPGDVVASAPYIYFEAREQLTSLQFLNHVQSTSYRVIDLLDAVETSDAKVLFVDPVANIAGLPTVDLRELASSVVSNPFWDNRWLVIDGTMISGGIDIHQIFPPAQFPRLLYYESGSKHLQMGLDLAMAGICVFPAEIAAEMRVQRRNTGTVLYPDAVARFPRTDRGRFLRRMQKLSENARTLANSLRNETLDLSSITVSSVEHWLALGWRHGGSIVTIAFKQPGLNNRDVLESFVHRLLISSKAQQIPLVRGVSFGLSTTRVSTASSTAAFHDPFIRFSVGTESTDQVKRIGTMAAKIIQRHLDVYLEDDPAS